LERLIETCPVSVIRAAAASFGSVGVDGEGEPLLKEVEVMAFGVIGDGSEKLKPLFFVKAACLEFKGVQPNSRAVAGASDLLGLGKQTLAKAMAAQCVWDEEQVDVHPFLE
jgi:hypothetical protein